SGRRRRPLRRDGKLAPAHLALSYFGWTTSTSQSTVVSEPCHGGKWRPLNARSTQSPVGLSLNGAGTVTPFEWPLCPSWIWIVVLPHGPDAFPSSPFVAPQLSFT